MSALKEVQAPAPAALDLDALEQTTSAELVLVHPVTGAPTAARITLAGSEHPARKAVVFARMRQRRAELERTGKLTIGDPVDDEQDEVALLAACTLGWSGLASAGQELKFSPAAALALYADPRRAWVRDQVKTGLDARALFFVGSANN